MLNRQESDGVHSKMNVTTNRFCHVVNNLVSRMHSSIFKYSENMRESLNLIELARTISDYSLQLRSFNNLDHTKNLASFAENNFAKVIQVISLASKICTTILQSKSANSKSAHTILQNLDFLFELNLEMMRITGGSASAVLNRIGAMNLAIDIQDIHLIKRLHALGVSVDTNSISDKTALQHAIESNHVMCILEVLQCVKDINKRSGINLETALHTAVRVGNVAVVDLLLCNGANLLIKDGSGYSPLYLAFYSKNQELMEYFVADKKLQFKLEDSIHNKSSWFNFDKLLDSSKAGELEI